MASIQSRLTLYIVVGTAILLVTAGVVVDRLLRNQLERDFDRNLLDKAMLLVSLTDRDARIIEFDFSDEFMPEFGDEDGEEAEYFEFRLPDGTPFARSESLEDDVLMNTTSPGDEPRFEDVELPDGRDGRMVVLSFAPQVDIDEEEVSETQASTAGDEDETQVLIPDSLPEDVKVELAVAKGKETLTELLGAIRTTLVTACLGLIGAVAIFVHLCVDRGLMPLRMIAGEVRNLDSTKLNTRLRTAPKSEELRPITDQLNHLLERLDEAFEREKRFSGNVAHELRTPIAELRTLAEVGSKWPADQSMVKGFFGDLVDLADDMERTVTNLLNLARLDAGQQELELESVNLAKVIGKCWKQLAAEAEKKGIRLENRIGDDLMVRTDKDKLVLIVINLFVNAVNYSPEQSSIVVEAKITNSRIQFSVSNLSVDLTERDLPLMFERFWRKDKARTKGRYAGLGLALVAALGEILDLKVSPALDPDGRFTMTLSGLEAT